MISLKKILIKNFRSFKGTHEIHFKPGFFCVKGFSGVGKSNILLAISYALGICPIPATQLQNVFTEDPMDVWLVLDVDGREIEICRGKTPSYNEQGWGACTGATAVNAKVDKLFGGQLDSVDLLTVRNQRSNGRFLSLDDSKKKTFLSTILGLTKLEDMIEYQKKTLFATRHDLNTTEKQIETATKFCPTGKNVELPSNGPDLDVAIFDLEVLIDQVTKEMGYLKEMIDANVEDRLFETNKHHETIKENLYEISQYKEAILKTDYSIRETDAAIFVRRRSLTMAKSELGAIGSAIAKNFSSLDKLSKNLCFTCGQKWEQVKDEEAILLKENVSLRNKEIDLGVQIKKLEEANVNDLRTCVTLNEQKAEYVNKVKSLTEALPKANFEGINLRIAMIDDELDTAREALNNAIFKKRKLENDRNEYGKKFDLWMRECDAWEKYHKETAKLKVEAEKLEAKVEDLKTSIDLNKEFLTKIFDEILYEISNNVNSNLSLIPNVNNISFEFSTVNTTKDGVVKNKIETNIYKNGIKMPGISGGQTSSLELLVDASVHSVISARTGLALNWLILDEPFEGLHPQDKEACLEVLKKLHPNKCVLIVDHSTETKEHFDGFLEVVSNEDGSSEIKAT